MAVSDQFRIRIEDLDLSEGEALFIKVIQRLRNSAIQPPKAIDVITWIETHVELRGRESSRTGFVKLTGFQREMVQAFVDPDVHQITIMKSQQVGFSKLIAWVALYLLVVEGSIVMIAEPDIGEAETFYAKNIYPFQTRMAAFNEIIRTPARGEVQDKSNEKLYSNGAMLYLRGAAGDDPFRQISSFVNFLDEVDAKNWWPSKISGDKVEQARGRGTDDWGSKIILGSTPLEKETSIVWREYQKSDQRQFFVHCPHCGHQQILEWGGKDEPFGFKYERGKSGAVVKAWYKCAGSKGCRIDEHNKEEMVDGGVWQPTATAETPGHVGYHIWAAYSLAPKASWRHLCQAWCDAQGEATKLATFWNLWLGKPFDSFQAQKIESIGLFARREPYAAEVPNGVVLMTCGVDVQTGSQTGNTAKQARLEASVWGWGRGEESWLIGHWKFIGEPMSPENQIELDAFLKRSFKKADGTEMKISATAIDLGGHYGDAVKDFTSSRAPWNIWATKGNNNTKGTRSGSLWPRRGASRKNGRSWYMLDSQQGKDVIGRRLLNTTPGPGYVHFPMSATEEYFEDLAAEELIRLKGQEKGFHWKRKKQSITGEAWDCYVLALAALQGLKTVAPQFANLSLAADQDGVPKEAEAYHGPDRSAQAAQPGEAPELKPAPKPAAKPTALEVKKAAQTAQVAAPAPAPAPGMQQQRKLHVSRSSFVGRSRW
jgi:phage terminase large subunit GpA-like protein